MKETMVEIVWMCAQLERYSMLSIFRIKRNVISTVYYKNAKKEKLNDCVFKFNDFKI